MFRSNSKSLTSNHFYLETKGILSQIRQVIINLVQNASEALVEPDGIIRISTEAVRLGSGDTEGEVGKLAYGEYIRLRVSDTGCGISAETRARMFDQFFTTKANGRGLGLATVHGIIRSHGGAINVASAPFVGSTFDVLLPCAIVSVAPEPKAFATR